MDGQRSSRFRGGRLATIDGFRWAMETVDSLVLVGDGRVLSADCALFGEATSGKVAMRSTLGEGNLRIGAGAGDMYLEVTSLLRGLRSAVGLPFSLAEVSDCCKQSVCAATIVGIQATQFTDFARFFFTSFIGRKLCICVQNSWVIPGTHIRFCMWVRLMAISVRKNGGEGTKSCRKSGKYRCPTTENGG